jgi:hypothetical protein
MYASSAYLYWQPSNFGRNDFDWGEDDDWNDGDCGSDRGWYDDFDDEDYAFDKDYSRGRYHRVGGRLDV